LGRRNALAANPAANTRYSHPIENAASWIPPTWGQRLEAQTKMIAIARSNKNRVTTTTRTVEEASDHHLHRIRISQS
jgi:hypothetical protein